MTFILISIPQKEYLEGDGRYPDTAEHVDAVFIARINMGCGGGS